MGYIMDKFVRILSEQNPEFELICKNPECRRKTKVRTVNYYSSPNGEYELQCPHCGMSTTYTGITKDLAQLKKKFKDIGIKW